MTMAAAGPADLRAQRRLVELEGVIQGGLQTFVDVGQALLEIRTQRLYRYSNGGEFATFEDYCRDRWQMGRAYANRIIEATEVHAALAPIGATPRTESQARELAPVLRERGPEVLRETWAAVVEQTNGHPTAAAVREVVAAVIAPPPPATAETPEQEATPIDDALWDALLAAIDALAGLSGHDANEVAATVPERRRAATAKRLRKLGSYLGRIAWTLEGKATDE